MTRDPRELVDCVRHPVDDLTEPRTTALARECRAALDATGVAIVPGFLTRAAVDEIVTECEPLAAGGHHQDIAATPYLELPDDGWPADHPRLATGRSALTAIPYDEFGTESPLRALYEWDALMDFVALALGKERLFRYDDDLGALNVAAMADGDELFWHFDQADFVVSVALQPSEAGGDFECVPMARTASDERYDHVAAILAGDPTVAVTNVPMDPGTLMLFEGRHTLHRVTPIRGRVRRYVALLAYDTEPETSSSELLRLVRYGRT